MVGDEIDRDAGMPMGGEFRPVQRENDLRSLCDDPRHHQAEDRFDIELVVPKQAVDLLDATLRRDAHRSRQSAADRSASQTAGMHHTEHRLRDGKGSLEVHSAGEATGHEPHDLARFDG